MVDALNSFKPQTVEKTQTQKTDDGTRSESVGGTRFKYNSNQDIRVSAQVMMQEFTSGQIRPAFSLGDGKKSLNASKASLEEYYGTLGFNEDDSDFGGGGLDVDG